MTTKTVKAKPKIRTKKIVPFKLPEYKFKLEIANSRMIRSEEMIETLDRAKKRREQLIKTDYFVAIYEKRDQGWIPIM